MDRDLDGVLGDVEHERDGLRGHGRDLIQAAGLGVHTRQFRPTTRRNARPVPRTSSSSSFSPTVDQVVDHLGDEVAARVGGQWLGGQDIATQLAVGLRPPVHLITHGGAFIIRVPEQEDNVYRASAPCPARRSRCRHDRLPAWSGRCRAGPRRREGRGGAWSACPARSREMCSTRPSRRGAARRASPVHRRGPIVPGHIPLSRADLEGADAVIFVADTDGKRVQYG